MPTAKGKNKKKRFSIQKLFVVLPYLLILTFVCFAIDTIAYPGFVQKYLLLNPTLLFVVSVTFLFIQSWWFIELQEKNSFQKFVFYITRALAIPLFCSNYLLMNLEKEHFINYVFSTFHIHLSQLRNLVVFTVFILLVDFITHNTSFILSLKKRLTSLIQLAFIISILFIVVPQINDTFTMMYGGSIDIIKAPFKTYDRKIVEQMNGNQSTGWIYTYSQFLDKYIPENGTIFIPPQIAPWLMEGNQYYIRWFLYPRDIVYSRDIEAPIPNEVGYVMIAYGLADWGPASFGWPKISIPKENIERIILIDRNTMEEKILTNTDYKLDDSQQLWGVIELKK